MEKLNATLLINTAREKLAGRNVRNLAAIHVGVTVAAGLLVTLLQYVLAQGIGKTSGLSGLGTRSILETVQMVLQWANMVLLPFWNLGFLYVALQWAKGGQTRKEDLLTGFRRVGPCLGLYLNRIILSVIIMILCVNISSVIFMMTPAAAPIAEMAASAGDTEALYEMLEQLTQQDIMDLFMSMIPMLLIWLGLCAVILLPLMYWFRMAEYVILEDYGARGLSSMLVSAAIMRRRRWQLFLVDLRLWWYYGLKLVCLLLCYADLLLGALGITLPFGSEGSFFASYLLYLVALFCVEVFFRPQVETVYACAYGKLKEMGPVLQKMPEPPRNMPWRE